MIHNILQLYLGPVANVAPNAQQVGVWMYGPFL